MNKKVRGIAGVIGAVILLASLTVLACDMNNYWKTYAKIFVDWDDTVPAAPPPGSVRGPRNVRLDSSLGQGYDWRAVSAMEDFLVPIDKQKAFLQDEALGPYTSLKGGGN